MNEYAYVENWMNFGKLNKIWTNKLDDGYSNHGNLIMDKPRMELHKFNDDDNWRWYKWNMYKVHFAP